MEEKEITISKIFIESQIRFDEDPIGFESVDRLQWYVNDEDQEFYRIRTFFQTDIGVITIWNHCHRDLIKSDFFEEFLIGSAKRWYKKQKDENRNTEEKSV